MCNFYKTNSEILKLDPFNKKDQLYIMFNHWIERKENLNRINGEKGTLEIAINVVEKEFEISRNKTQRMIKWFEEKGIIECLTKSKTKGKPSIYAYTSVFYEEENSQKSNTNRNTNDSTNDNTNNPSNCNDLADIDNTNDNTNSNTNNSKYKKDNINREYKKNIYSRVIEKLNSTANTKYRASTKKTQTLIDARLNDGFTVEDFEKVINVKASEWLGTEWEKFLRPETLFGNKFEGYLNQKEKAPTGIGARKNNYNSSIYNNTYKNTEKIQGHKFV